MDHQRHGRQRLDLAQAVKVKTLSGILLQMDVANGNGHRIHAGFPRKARGLVRDCARRCRPPSIADKADLAFARCPRRMGEFGHASGQIDVGLQRQF